MKMVNNIKIAIAGLGRSGWLMHAHTLAQLPAHYRVAAGFDADEKRRQALAERFDCPAYADFADLLRDERVAWVVVALPSHLHAEYAIRALRAGKHVIVEKPMARDLAEVDAMIQAAGESGCHLTVFQNGRYMPDFARVREVIASGRLGKILQIRMGHYRFRRRWDWQTLVEFGGGQLNNMASHTVDKALLLLPQSEPNVLCRMERTPLWSGDAESHVKIVLQVPGGPLIDIETTSACAYPQYEWLIMGTQGSLTGSPAALRWKYINPAYLPERPVLREMADREWTGAEELPWVEESADLAAEAEFCDMAYYLDLHASLARGAPPPVTPQSVRRTTAVLEACRAASALMTGQLGSP